jgi:putative transposase
VDNGAEFHSQAFERGCEQHGIGIDWRPPGQPHVNGGLAFPKTGD